MMTAEQILAAMEELIAAARASEDGALTEEQAERYEALEAELRQVQRQDQIEKRHAAWTRPLPTPRTGGREVTPESRAFENYLRSGDVAEYRAQSEGVPTEGGYTVPIEFRDKIVECMQSFGGLAEVVETITTSDGRVLEWPTVSDSPSSVPNKGVITAEGAQQASGGADLVFGTNNLGAYKYTTTGASNEPLRLSVELLQDSAIDIQALVSRKFAERIARRQALHWATGTGVTEPLGILVGTANAELVTSNNLSNAANGYAKLLEIEDALDSFYLPNARWVMNRATWTEVRKIVDDVDRPLIMANAQSGIGGKIERTLLGYPVTIDEGFPSAAQNVNFLVFGDVNAGYVIRRVKDVQVLVDPYTRGKYGQVEMTAWARADGTIQDRCAFVIVKGID